MIQLAVETIIPNPFQPRTLFNELELDELSDSIRQPGVMQPIVVRQTERGFELIAGERRWRASQRAGLSDLPAIVRDLDDQQVAALALIENIQREQLTAIEQARALARMRDEFSMDQTALAAMISSSRSNVANLLRLLNLAQSVQTMLETGNLEMGHARALLPLPENMQQKTAEDVLITTYRQTETWLSDCYLMTRHQQKPMKDRMLVGWKVSFLIALVRLFKSKRRVAEKGIS